MEGFDIFKLIWGKKKYQRVEGGEGNKESKRKGEHHRDGGGELKMCVGAKVKNLTPPPPSLKGSFEQKTTGFQSGSSIPQSIK